MKDKGIVIYATEEARKKFSAAFEGKIIKKNKKSFCQNCELEVLKNKNFENDIIIKTN